MPFLSHATSPPSVSLGTWLAYAGDPQRDDSTPRGRIRRAVERLMLEVLSPPHLCPRVASVPAPLLGT